MLKKHIAACMLASALVATPALAQTTDTPAGAAPPASGDTMQPRQPGADTPATQMPAAEAPAQPGAGAPAAATATDPASPTQTDVTVQATSGGDLELENGFIVSQNADHQLVNDLMGKSVMGADDSAIGSIKDLVMDSENRLVGVIVGVGGFLGIGEKLVGMPMDALTIIPEVEATAATGGGDAFAREIEEIRVDMTREDLENAPEFARLEPPPAAEVPAATPGTAPAPGGMAPPQPN